MSDLRGLIERVEKAREVDNRLDCEIDVALFKPDRRHRSVRMNAAGTKLIYTRHDGSQDTYRSWLHTLNVGTRVRAIALLRSLNTTEGGEAE